MPGPFDNPSQWTDCSDAELEALAEQADFSGFVPGRDLAPLRERLLRLEREHGITEVHRRLSDKVLAAGARLVETPRYIGTQSAFALSPDGRHLAIASNRFDGSHGGDVRIWELATGRMVDAVGFESTRVGSGGDPSCLQWSPSGQWLGVILDGVIVGVLRAFAGAPPCFTADVTRRWGSPPAWAVINPEHSKDQGHLPAWCWSPDETRLFISTPGPDGALGCIVPFQEGARINEDSEGLRWCAARLDGRPSRSQPHTWVRWSPDGSRIHGYCKHEYVLERHPDSGQDAHPSASVIDVQSGDLQYRFDELKLPVAFSPDGARLAYGEDPPRLANGYTGQTMANLARRARVHIHSVAECVWSRDGRRLAVLVNEYDHPKAFIFEEGQLLCVVDLKGRYLGRSSWSHDLLRWAWSPDGSMGACLTRENNPYREETQGGIEVWTVGPAPGFLRRLEYAGHINGLAWGADDTLVATGQDDLAFWDVTTGQPRFRASSELEPGRVPPPDAWNPWPDATARFIPTERGWDFTRVEPDGTVVCPPGSRAELATRLMFSVEGRHAWPWRWAVGTRHARWEDNAPAPVAPQVPDKQPGLYRAEPAFMFLSAIRRDNLAPYVGQTLLLRLLGSSNAIGVLREATEKGLLLDPPCPSPRSNRDPVLPYDEIAWVGPAVALEGPATGP
ncbi:MULTISPECIES: WD40 repeat domain-containing protein [unclassified Corallococcus]|uniref:WD40 repeat domain-containing protein n=1 Tax=unclassified Corallococcus TaxID=2685029 RepID=UPI001F5DD1DF|nr:MULTISPECIES: hypothetical protein [unclassified Corallococcus]WAS88725.1 hypothetical protein O0N60_17465 [Corallococcus sp. NCRR]